MTEQYKQFIPCIYLKDEKAVRSLADSEITNTDPVALAKRYSENHADGLIIFDQSEGDEAHEAALDIIKEICTAVSIPVIGAGNIRRMEDVKKLLYAGC